MYFNINGEVNKIGFSFTYTSPFILRGFINIGKRGYYYNHELTRDDEIFAEIGKPYEGEGNQLKEDLNIN